MAAGERVEERRIALALGHALLAPATAVWTGILCGFLVQTPWLFGEILSVQRNGRANLGGATPAGGFYIGAVLIVPMVVPLLASWTAAFGFWTRRPWARRLAVGLSLICGVAILNGLLWTGLYLSHSDSFVERALPPMLLILAAVALPWCGYVLVHTRPSRWAGVAPPHPGRRRLLMGLSAVAVLAAWHIPVHFRSQHRRLTYVLWRGERAYVCAGRVTSAGHATLGSVVGTFLGYAPLTLSGKQQRSDVVVAEIAAGGYRLTEVPDFPGTTLRGALDYQGGQCHVREGSLLYQDQGGLWRWRDGAFEEVPDVKRLEMQEAHPYGMRSDEGWQVDSFAEPGHRLAIDLPGTSAVLRLDGDTRAGGGQKFDGPERVLLQLGESPEVPLLVVQRDPVWISVREYRALGATRP